MYTDSIVEEQTLLVVLDTGSFSAAAVELGVSQSSVSRRIAALEDRLGGRRLLSRTTRRVEATEYGLEFAAGVRRALSLLHDAQQQVISERDRPAGLLRISVPPGVGRGVLIPALSDLALTHPELEYDIHFASRYQDLYDGNLDMVVRLMPFQRTDTCLERLGTVRWVFTAAPDYLGRVDGRRLSDFHFVALNMRSGGPVDPETSKVFRLLKRQRVRIAVNDTVTMRQFLISGHGVGLMPWPLVRDDVEHGRLELVDPGFGGTESSVYAIYRRCLHGMPKIHAVLDTFVDALAAAQDAFAVAASGTGIGDAAPARVIHALNG